MDRLIGELGRRVLDGERLGRPDLLGLAAAGEKHPYDLMYWADKARTSRFGSAVKLCSIVPGKLGNCGEDCKWCAQSAICADTEAETKKTKKSKKTKYASIDEIFSAAQGAMQVGSASLGIVNSGRCPSKRDLDAIAGAVARIKSDSGGGPAENLEICASLGELTDAQARRLTEAGVARYNHNLETSRTFYPRVVTSHDYDGRVRTLATARRAGLSLCCGGIFGLGETWDDRIDLAIAIRDEISPEVVPLNFLHPIPGTPLENSMPLRPVEILSIIAVFRLAMPHVDIKIAGGREKNLRSLQSWIFYAGATGCMVGNYLTTSGRAAEDDIRMIGDLGLRIVSKLPDSHS